MGRIATLFVVGSLAGCAAAPSEREERVAEFEDAYADLEAEFGGDDKADLWGALRPDPCTLLAPLTEDGDHLHMGVFAGVEGDGALGPGAAFGGMDLVWDFYHHQFFVAKYTGLGIRLPALGGGVGVYAGFGFGFDNGVADWEGHFLTAEVALGLPFLRDYLSIDPAVFLTAVDQDGDGEVGPHETLSPPAGVYGFDVKVEVGYNLLADPLPFSGAVTQGEWTSYDEMTRHYYDRFAGARLIAARLVDAVDGSECSPDWPEERSGQRCVVEFGDPSQSHTRRGLYTGLSVCDALGGCAIPLSWPASATAVAIGAARDASSLTALCSE